MTVFGILGFSAPWILLGLLAIPILWVLLRAVPPAPIRRRFPGVALLLGLKEDEAETDKTPWWLLLLRALAVAAIIVGFAGPVLNPNSDRPSDGPILVLMDGTWTSAPDWQTRRDQATAVIEQAARDGRAVAFGLLSNERRDLTFQVAEIAARRVGSLNPNPWPVPADLTFDLSEDSFETYYIASPQGFAGQEALIAGLQDKGPVTVYQTGLTAVGLRPLELTSEGVKVTLLRSVAGGAATFDILAKGTDPNGQEAVLANQQIEFSEGETLVQIDLPLPAELRNRLTRVEIAGLRSAGAVTLADDRLRRREIALISGRLGGQEGTALLSPMHYLRQALVVSADLLEGTLGDLLQANPDAVILADVASVAEKEALTEWVEGGGLLVRFAGPRVAGGVSTDIEDDPLMPVRLRAGGRTVGGAMSWGAPKALQPFPQDSPFYGLPTPGEVAITGQVLAEPGPQLASRVIARLEDGTPLVTRKKLGEGQVVLFHVTANAEWSSLPLSGLFMSMLERLSVTSGNAAFEAAKLEGTTWQLSDTLDAFGNLQRAGDRPGVAGEDLIDTVVSADLPPGLYQGQDRRLARNVIGAQDALIPPDIPAGVRFEGPGAAQARNLAAWFLLAALGLGFLDLIAAIWLSGKLRGPMSGVAILLAAFAPTDPQAQSELDASALSAAGEVVLAYVETGDTRQDELSYRGLLGLSFTLFDRTSVEPAEPAGVDLATDDIALYPFLYWPITADQPLPNSDARAKLNRFLKSGGMIMFDTRDAEVSGFGRATPEARKLQAIAQGLNIPPIAPIPEDHVLTRTFYLIQDFPGRHIGPQVWVEAAPPGDVQAEGMPFRNLNDGVTPVVIGGNDWAAAWAVDDNGQPFLPLGRGFSGERQREIARRFGVNLIMHVLTGNYKSDQVHVPALLDRLGQ